MAQCVMSSPALIGVGAGVVGFIAGFIVAKFCGGGSSCYAGGDGDCVEIYVSNLKEMSPIRNGADGRHLL